MKSEPQPKFEYDLYNPEHRQRIKDFENELNGRSFEQFCFDIGFTIKNEKYPYGAMNYSRLNEYEDARLKLGALRALKDIRKSAEKKEAEANQSLELDVNKIAELF